MNRIRMVSAAFVMIAVLSLSIAVPVLADGQPGMSANGVFQAGNATPVVQTVTTTAGSTVTPTPFDNTTLPFVVTVTDSAGYADIANVSAQVFQGSTPYGTPVITSGQASGSGTTATYNVPVNFYYYWAVATYSVKFTATTNAGVQSNVKPYSGNFAYQQMIAIGITGQTTLNFGTLQPGVASVGQQTQVTNGGNVALNTVSGQVNNWNNGAGLTIPATSLSGAGSGSSAKMSTGPTTFPSTTLATGVPGATTQATLTFIETVPSGTNPFSGTYSTAITVSGAQ